VANDVGEGTTSMLVDGDIMGAIGCKKAL